MHRDPATARVWERFLTSKAICDGQKEPSHMTITLLVVSIAQLAVGIIGLLRRGSPKE